MVFYTGKVLAKDLFSTIIGHITAVQPAQSAAWWVNESSLASDGVLTSKGSTGNERIVAVMREGAAGHYITYGRARDYTPGQINVTGAFDTLVTQNMYYHGTAQDTNTMVQYDLSVTADRIILHLQGDKLISGWRNPVLFLGMPIRYDQTDKYCIADGLSEGAATTTLRLVENAIHTVNTPYSWYSVTSPGGPSWGNTYFVETLHFGLAAEGLRGEIDGLYGIHSDGISDGDEIDINGVRFLAIKRVVYGNNSFTRDVLLMRKS